MGRAAPSAAVSPALERREIFVAGEFRPATSSRVLPVFDPSYGEQVGSVAEPSRADVDAAVAAARAAFDHGPWPATEPEQRAAALERIADGIEARGEELTELTVIERGVPVSEAPMHVKMAAMWLRQYAGLARAHTWIDPRPRLGGGVTHVVAEPAGVVAGIVSWNGPLPGATGKLGPALAAGCCVVLKPAPETPLSSYVLAEVIAASGLPDGVVSILAADREVGGYLTAHPGVDMVAFTGSSATGKAILAACAERVARVTLELGGKSAAIMLEDADLDSSLPALVAGSTRSTGQACWANSRLLVPRRRQGEVVEAIAAAYRGLKVGDAHEASTALGPIALERQLRRIEEYVSIGAAEGARLVCGGGRPDDLDAGWFIAPTLFDGVDNSMRIAREEIFGPVQAVIPYDTEAEAVAIANDSPYGLSGSVFSADGDRAYAVARRLRTGMVGINGMYLDPSLPWGGFKESGLGREGGPEGLDEYTETKVIHLPPAE